MSCLRTLVFLGLALYSLRVPASAAPTHKLKVLTSFLPVYCFTANVAGDLAQVENLLPANVEPHDYQFSRRDLQKLAHADLIVINGLGLEGWLERAFQNFGWDHPKAVVEIASGLESQLIYAQPPRVSLVPRSRRSKEVENVTDTPIRLLTPAPTVPGREPRSSWLRGARPNPHIWLDPRLACQAVTNILRALQQADPANAQGYATNAARYVGRLEQLDATLQQILAPVRGASIVTCHDAFPYFARRYGLNIVGVIESMPDVEPSLKYLAALYRSIRANQVKVILTAPPSASRLAEQMGCDLHLRLAQIDTLEAGSLNPIAYEEVMRSNALVLLKNLKPDAERISP